MNPPARPRVVSLFSGIGATDLALEHLGCETVAHSDIEPYANDVFALRFPGSTQLGSVTDITTVPACEVMAGGFPCQDISGAGHGEGITGARSALWHEYARLIGVVQPRVAIIENVSMLLIRGLDVVLTSLFALGYACEWDCIPAAAVGAAHLRDRIWITAYHEDQEPVREDRLERSLGTLALPPSKWPRAGRMCQGAVYVREPLARRKTKRLNPGSAWVGAQLTTDHGWWHGPHFPTPPASSYGADQGGAAGRVGPVRHSLESMARHAMWPTPTKSDGTGGPGSSGRAGGDNLRTAVAKSLYLTPTASPWDHGGGGGEPQAEVNAAQEGEGLPRGPLNPRWVEWLMGFPLGWTDLEVNWTRWHGWNHEPRDVPRVAEAIVDRQGRLTALGNAQVPQVARWWAAPAIERLR